MQGRAGGGLRGFPPYWGVWGGTPHKKDWGVSGGRQHPPKTVLLNLTKYKTRYYNISFWLFKYFPFLLFSNKLMKKVYSMDFVLDQAMDLANFQ